MKPFGSKKAGEPKVTSEKPPIATRLEINIHLSDGSVEKFEQKDPQILGAHLLEFKGSSVFNQTHIPIETPDGVFSYPTSAVCKINYFMDYTPEWAKTFGRDITIITPEKFKESRSKSRLTRDDVKKLKPGDKFTGHVVMQLSSGDKVYVEVTTTIPGTIDQRRIIAVLLNLGTIVGQYPEGGICMINTANIVRIAFYPGAPELSPNAWQMNCM